MNYEIKEELNNVYKQLNLLKYECDTKIKDNKNYTHEQREETVKEINKLREKAILLEERIGGLMEVENRLDTQSTNLRTTRRGHQ